MTETTHEDLEQLIRRMVREVLNRMGSQTNTDNENNHTTLDLSAQRLVALAHVQGQLDGMQQVLVESSAVVTPAVKDYLREQDVVLRRGSLQVEHNEREHHAEKIAIADPNDSMRGQSFAAQLSRRTKVQAEQASLDLADFVLADVPQPLVAQLCQGGRVAAQVGAIDEVPRVMAMMTPQVWVLDMKRLNLISAVNVGVQALASLAHDKATKAT